MEVIVGICVSRMTLVFFLILVSCLSGWTQAKPDPSRFDGPAELPRVYVKSALSDTPAPGKSILVKTAPELNQALDKAACGDTIRLQAGTEFAGLEITRSSPGEAIYNLAGFARDAVGDHLVFDRVWMHGTAQDETTRGLALGRSRHVAVVDSYLNDFHCVAKTGTCIDAQTITG